MKATEFGKVTVFIPNEPLIDAPDDVPRINWPAIGSVDVATTEAFLKDLISAIAFIEGVEPSAVADSIAVDFILELRKQKLEWRIGKNDN